MAQNQREINRLRHIIEEKDREIEMLRENEDDSRSMNVGITEEFSHRVTELEGGTVKGGLTDDSQRMDSGISEELSHRVTGLEGGIVKGLADDSRRMNHGISDEVSRRVDRWIC